MTLLNNILCILPFLLLSSKCRSDHILVTATGVSYSHWSQILHISKGLLSRNNDHFITFMIDESKDNYLDTFRNEPFDTTSYQIIYTATEPDIDTTSLLELNMLYMMFKINTFLYEQSSTSAEQIAVFLNHTQSQSIQDMLDLQQFMNQNLKHKQNDITSLILDQKVDICLVDYFHFFGISLCNLFDIPVLLRVPPSLTALIEYSTIMNTHLYFYNPFILDSAPKKVNGTIMTYGVRWKTFMQNMGFKTFQRFMSYYKVIPMIHELNDRLSTLNIDAYIDTKRYKNGWFSFWAKTAIITSLGPPFSPAIYHRPRVKQYGFLLYSSKSATLHDSDLWQWINNRNTPILVISMGSKIELTKEAMHSIYTQLLDHSKAKNYRVLWALRQIVYEDLNKTNEELETEYFKISRWIPQSDILQHKNVKLFFSHAGSGGTIEGLYSKTLMVLYPFGGDQPVNAQRLFELECGLIIKDKEHLSDLTQHIDKLLVDKTTSDYYQNKLNHIHSMISANGGLSEAVDFVEYAAKYGIKHLLCSYGANYDCTETVVPWYQQSMWDIYLVLLLIVSLFIIIIKKLWLCLLGLSTNNKSEKSKTE